jgi:protoporphyrinogen oxidase
MKTLDKILTVFPGLYFTGNAYDGVGLNDCVLRSDKIVSQMAAHLEL